MSKGFTKTLSAFSNYRLQRRRLLYKMMQAAGFSCLHTTISKSVFAENSNAQPPLFFDDYHKKNADWIAEARIGGLAISGDIDDYVIRNQLKKMQDQGVSVVEADSRLSDYLTEDEFDKEMRRITIFNAIADELGIKSIWYIPGLEVITPNGIKREDSFARVHKDWLQLSFDRKSRGVFYGSKVFWIEESDESAWLCPNSPYRQWYASNLRKLAATGLDGIWIDVPIFDQIAIRFGCACNYCQEKFSQQTGYEFPRVFDITDKRFWSFVRWRHHTLTEFLEFCKQEIESVEPDVLTVTEIVALDHTGATQLGTEGSDLKALQVIWEVDVISETTGMAEAQYDDWFALYNIYRYCRGASFDRPSWAFCYGFKQDDAQLVFACAIATQNNPYELRAPEMTTTVGHVYRKTQFQWLKKYSKEVFKSRSIASVAVLYSERNRDFLNANTIGGIFISDHSPGRDRLWLGNRSSATVEQTYLSDYRGLSIMLFQHQVPTDIYPISRVNLASLEQYKVLIVPTMASISEKEKKMFLALAAKGTTILFTGKNIGLWDENVEKREQIPWAEPIDQHEETTINVGKGRLVFWRTQVGKEYISSHSQKLSKRMLALLQQSNVRPWVSDGSKVIIQPYIYRKSLIVHILNFSWVGSIESQANRIQITLDIPWPYKQNPEKVMQTEPTLSSVKYLDVEINKKNLQVVVDLGINAMLIFECKSELSV